MGKKLVFQGQKRNKLNRKRILHYKLKKKKKSQNVYLESRKKISDQKKIHVH